MANRQPITVTDRLRAIELDPDFTWEDLQRRLRNTDRKIRMLQAVAMRSSKKRKPRAKMSRKKRLPASA